MQNHRTTLLLCAAIAGLAGAAWAVAGASGTSAQAEQQPAATGAQAASQSDRLAVLWTSGDPEVAHRVALMYTHNAMKQGWFDEVRLIIWGPSQRLLVADKDVKDYIRRMQEDGVIVQACIVCARSYGIVDDLRSLDIEVKAMGVPLTEHLKDDWKVLSF